MLDTNIRGYAVMTGDLTAISFESETIDSCKRYCRNGYVIAERIPVVRGFSIQIMWLKYYKAISFRYTQRNILWLHFNFHKEYIHKTGKIVYFSLTQKAE